MAGTPNEAPLDTEEALQEIRRQVRVQYRGYVVAVAVVCLIVGGLIGALASGEEPGAVALTPPPSWGAAYAPAVADPDATPRPTVTPPPLRVYVSGAVVDPKVVVVPAGSLLGDALEAVGGPAADADLESVNLAAPLADHQHVTVPRLAGNAPEPTPAASLPVETQPAQKPGGTVAGEHALVNINTASAAELETLPHIGPALAQRIIAHREAHGPFARVEDLQNVSGIGEGRYADIAPLITVGP